MQLMFRGWWAVNTDCMDMTMSRVAPENVVANPRHGHRFHEDPGGGDSNTALVTLVNLTHLYSEVDDDDEV